MSTRKKEPSSHQDRKQPTEEMLSKKMKQASAVSTRQTAIKKPSKDELKGKDCDTKTDFSDVTALIRSLQRTEGNPDCFGKANEECDQVECMWRKYCLPSPHTHKHTPTKNQTRSEACAIRGLTGQAKRGM